MERHGAPPLLASARWLGAGVTGGFVCGLLFGGIGGRLAMFVLRLTSDRSLRGVTTDDGFTIGVFSTATLFLLGVTSALGVLGGLVYLVVREWFPPGWRVTAMALFFGAIGSAGVIGPDGIDFSLLSPLPLAIAMFVAIPVAYGVTMPLLAESLLREGSWVRRTRWGWLAALLPLALANVFGVLVLAVAVGTWWITTRAPALARFWRSSLVTWTGRLVLVAATAFSAMKFTTDTVKILS
jgi:MFS family permease